MGDTRHHLRSFGAGEVTPEFFGMIADPKFQTGAARVRNYVVKPHGPIENRAGTEFVREVADSSKLTRTLPFVYGFGQSLIIEFAEGVFRFHAEGQTILFPVAAAWATATAYARGDLVLEDGTTYYATEAHTSGTFATDLTAEKWYAQPADGVYEVPHEYLEDELFEVTYAQSGDVVQLRHRNHPRRELRRTAATTWLLVDIEVGPGIVPPSGESGTPTAGAPPGTPFNTSYVITAITTDGDESLASGVVVVSNNLYDDGAYNTIDWDAHADPTVVRYNVYKLAAGLYGYIGQTDQITFQDDNIAPDLGATPPLDIDLFGSEDNYPGAVAYQDQRKAEAGSINQPQNVWMTRSGSENNFNYSIPAKDDDSIQFKIASRENNAIYHLVPMSDLIACTPAALWRISGGLSEVLTPLTLTAKEQTFVGCSQTKPLKVGNNMLYIAARGGHLREFGFDGDRNGYISGDISIRAPHLFDEDGVRSMTAQYDPFPMVQACMTSGLMVGLTYIPEQQIAAFSWHDTGPLDEDGVARDAFEDATTIYEEGRDVTYVVVRREIDGETVRYIERFADRRFGPDAADQFFVDCGYRYVGMSPVNELTGLDWLEGEEVAILADGSVVPNQTVVDGTLTLPDEIEATKINVGLPYVCQLQTLPMALEMQGYGQGMPKNVNEVVLRVYRSSAVFAGPSFDADELVEAKVRMLENLGSPPGLVTGVMEIVTRGKWEDDGQVCIQHVDPLAQTILSMTIDATVGGG